MDLELGQLELRYEKLRRRNARREQQLVASLAEKGQLLPAVVVRDANGGFVLVDGYKRVRALRGLRVDLVTAVVWDLGELDAVLLERLMRSGDVDGALEQGWLLEELNERFGLSHEELARRFDKSQSWVSRRLALVRALPREIQSRVQSGVLPAHAAMKFLVPMARAKRADCLRLVTALGQRRPSTRELGTLYATWLGGSAKTRELVVTQPMLVLQARAQASGEDAAPREKTPGRALLDDFGILIGTSRRAREKLARGVIAQLLPTEDVEVRRAVLQSKWECEVLFRRAFDLLARPGAAPAAPQHEATDAG